jgi:signal transduction histidine kinase
MTEPRRASELTTHSSHEIRNALACIHQFGNILADGLAGDLSHEQREYIGIMLDNASRIRSLLDRAVDGPVSTSVECTNEIEPLSRLET